MLTSKQKEAVKAVLYSQPTDDELMAHNGKDRVRDNRNNTTVGNASTHKADVMDWKVDRIKLVSNYAPEIMAIFVDRPTGKKIAEINGITPSAVSIAKKLKSYGIRCYERTYQIEKIALLTEA